MALPTALLLACALLPAAPVHADEAKPSLHPQHSSAANTNPEPLVMKLSQRAGSEHSESSMKHSREERHHCSTCDSDDSYPSQSALTCTAKCPLCPQCPPAQTCPSPCPSIPKCPTPQECASPCKACPACPSCKRHIPPGYEHFPEHGYYRLHTVPVTWIEAKATCEREGAHLAIINSQVEADLMTTLFKRDLEIGTWIYLGFHDLYKEGKYVTLFGKPLSTTGYTTWNPGQPDNHHGNENCGSMFSSGGLNDLDCSAKQPFVCELPV